jgi:hypothetical protein
MYERPWRLRVGVFYVPESFSASRSLHQTGQPEEP